MHQQCKRSRSGFTLIEMVVVILVICVLIAIAVPSYQKARESARTRSCLANLRSILSAKENYAAEKRLQTGDEVDFSDLAPVYLRPLPACPAGGTYTVNAVGTDSECSYPGHEL